MVIVLDSHPSAGSRFLDRGLWSWYEGVFAVGFDSAVAQTYSVLAVYSARLGNSAVSMVEGRID